MYLYAFAPSTWHIAQHHPLTNNFFKTARQKVARQKYPMHLMSLHSSSE
jgi:hypothetical protein